MFEYIHNNQIIMSGCNRLIIVFLLLLADVMSVSAANRFRVTDDILTVYGEPERINVLGKLHQGDEYEIVGQEGNMYIFMYNGKTAYAASYCCKLIEAAEPECNVEPEETEAVVEIVGAGDSGLPFRDAAEWMKGLLGLLVMAGFVAGVWSLVGPNSFNRLFDNLAGQNVSDCSRWMYCRPAIAIVIFGLTGSNSDNIGAALAVTAVYEILLLGFRANKLHSFRAAVAEALYLLFSGMGMLLLFWLFIIFAFLAAGGSSSSSVGDGENKSESGNSCGGDCRDCDHGPGSIWCIGTPAAGYKCSHYINVTGPK
ncbi:MAG: hypothetical protein PUA96_06770 [Bacteroidales bacterium]|nr:hypothetical protein [Bacteroidales bacterium]